MMKTNEVKNALFKLVALLCKNLWRNARGEEGAT